MEDDVGSSSAAREAVGWCAAGALLLPMRVAIATSAQLRDCGLIDMEVDLQA
jgi:hypothetical protein